MALLTTGRAKTAKPTPKRRKPEPIHKRLKADKAVYPGAGASLLGDKPGVRSKTEADQLIKSLFGDKVRTQ